MQQGCPAQFHGIDHVVLQVTDSERAFHFYTHILGPTVERVIEDLQIYQLRCGQNPDYPNVDTLPASPAD
jgi:catechol 2,3-dioxygenase-like lactoylglutathione lyase family enzyme